jgi:hypothetical protein
VVCCDGLTRWPTRKPAQRARKARLRAFVPEPHGRDPQSIEARLQALRPATPLTADAGVIAPNRRLVDVLVQP